MTKRVAATPRFLWLAINDLRKTCHRRPFSHEAAKTRRRRPCSREAATLQRRRPPSREGERCKAARSRHHKIRSYEATEMRCWGRAIAKYIDFEVGLPRARLSPSLKKSLPGFRSQGSKTPQLQTSSAATDGTIYRGWPVRREARDLAGFRAQEA